jgi:ABC-type cobalamin/Fe3+-siderophores transport system ATPase subunit
MEGSLSDGQRNTAALALLLAQEGGPLVIDQPEDELDSNFVFRELIPMLRKVKSKRQLIMATHNANLPVNGDAELGGCPRIAIVARARLIESDFSII